MTKRNPRCGDIEGFLLVRVSYSQASTVLLIPVQPFANIVGDYTCQYRDNECDDILHVLPHLLSAGGTRLYYIIISIITLQSVFVFYIFAFKRHERSWRSCPLFNIQLLNVEVTVRNFDCCVVIIIIILSTSAVCFVNNSSVFIYL